MLKLIFSTYDSINNPYYGGGGAIAIHEIAKRLAKNYSVSIITSSYPNAKNQIIDGVSYQFIGSSNLTPKISQLVFSLTLPWKIINSKFDIWYESFTPPVSTSFLQLFTDKPVVGVAHMLAGEDMKRKYHIPFDIIENIGLKTYKNIIATSEVFAKKIVQVAPEAGIAVIPNGVDKVKQVKRIEKYYLFFGRIEVNQKGLDILVDTFKKLKKEKLIICGSGENKEVSNLTTLINKNNLQDRVKMVGKKSQNEIKELAKNAKAVLVTSRFETFSMVALEALAMGVPLFTFDILGLKWVPDNCAIKVSPVSSESLFKSIQKISKSKIDINLKIKNGLVLASNYTWDSVANKYKNFSHQLLNKNESKFC